MWWNSQRSNNFCGYTKGFEIVVFTINMVLLVVHESTRTGWHFYLLSSLIFVIWSLKFGSDISGAKNKRRWICFCPSVIFTIRDIWRKCTEKECSFTNDYSLLGMGKSTKECFSDVFRHDAALDSKVNSSSLQIYFSKHYICLGLRHA